jgi:hypothetical protein
MILATAIEPRVEREAFQPSVAPRLEREAFSRASPTATCSLA